LAKHLSEIDPARLLVIDLNARGITKQLDRQVPRLDGRRFVVAGISKYDWLYSGIDFGFLTWERLGHDPKRFRLLGFSTRLPEAVAIDWMSREEQGGIEVLASGFWATLDWLDERLGLAAGAAVLLIAIALRLILFPIGFLETRSRMLRAHIDRRLGEAEPPRWQGAAPTLKRLLGVHRGWEIAGTLVTLALLIPAYRVLADAEKPLYEPFLWIHSLSERDVVLGLIVAGLVFVKLALAGSGPRWLPIAGALAFVPILFAIPSAVLVYAFGVLAVTAVQDGIARWSARTALSRALIHS
jgi:membrane protein insertase Oxa1/YidC/SpoIIIJ